MEHYTVRRKSLIFSARESCAKKYADVKERTLNTRHSSRSIKPNCKNICDGHRSQMLKFKGNTLRSVQSLPAYWKHL